MNVFCRKLKKKKQYHHHILVTFTVFKIHTFFEFTCFFLQKKYFYKHSDTKHTKTMYSFIENNKRF